MFPTFSPIALRIVTSSDNMRTYLLEKTIKVNMHNVPSVGIHEDVFKMTITETTIRVNRMSSRKDDDYRTQG